MDLQELLASLRHEFPGRNIVCIPPEEPKEIIVELDRDESSSQAVALIKRSEPHVHHRITERYEVLSGRLILTTSFGITSLAPGDTYIINPESVHHAESGDGSFTRVRVTSNPPWSPDDHILVPEPS